MNPHQAEPTIESRTSAAERFDRLCEPMSPELRQSWHGARMAMGITRATMLLEDTLRFQNQNTLENIMGDTQGEG